MRKQKRNRKWTDRATQTILRKAANKTINYIKEALPTKIKGWKVKRENLAKVLIASTLTRSTPPRIAEAMDIADQDTTSYQLRKTNVKACEKLNKTLAREAVKLVGKGLHLIAIDTTDIPYWGSRDAWTHYSPFKRCYAHRYAVASVLDGVRRVPITVRPVAKGQFPENIVVTLLEDLESVGIEARLVILDRGYHSAAVIRELKERRIAFIIGARKTKRVKKALEAFDEVKGKVYVTRLVVESRGAEVIREEVLLVAWFDGKDWITVLCWGLKPTSAQVYWMRWGVETCIRMLKLPLAKTCSRSLALRWFLLLVSALLYVVYALFLSCGLVPESYADFLSLLSLVFLLLLVPRYWLEVLWRWG